MTKKSPFNIDLGAFENMVAFNPELTPQCVMKVRS